MMVDVKIALFLLIFFFLRFTTLLIPEVVFRPHTVTRRERVTVAGHAGKRAVPSPGICPRGVGRGAGTVLRALRESARTEPRRVTSARMELRRVTSARTELCRQRTVSGPSRRQHARSCAM